MIFIKIKNLIEQQKKDVNFFIKKIKLENEVSNLINNKSFKIMGEVLENGYVLTDKQHDKLCKFLIENKDTVKHHELISSGYQFPNKTFKIILKKNPNLLLNNDNPLTKQLFNKIKNDDSFNLELFNLWKKTHFQLKNFIGVMMIK